MPTKREREYYRMGFEDGLIRNVSMSKIGPAMERMPDIGGIPTAQDTVNRFLRSKPKRKLSAWNKYVKANSKKPRFRYRNGKLNLKKMAVAFRKTPAGKKKRG